MYWAVGIPEGDPSAPLRCSRDDGTKGLTFFALTAAHYSCILYNNSLFLNPWRLPVLAPARLQQAGLSSHLVIPINQSYRERWNSWH